MSIVVRPLPPETDRPLLEQGVRVGFGVVAIVTELLLRVMSNPGLTPTRRRRAGGLSTWSSVPGGVRRGSAGGSPV